MSQQEVVVIDLSGNIRSRRTQLGLTLETLAERTGVSRAMLSEIERGSKNPTIKVVCQIAEGLGCTVSQLLGEEVRTPETLQIVRQSDRQLLLDPHSGVERYLLSPTFHRRGIELLWYVIPPGQSTGTFPPHRAGVEEHITVVQGCLHCRLGTWEVTLEAGDSLSFPANLAHNFHNDGSESCQYFLVIDSSEIGRIL
jgi:transcriptional regulator with XRE-family HTH domain